MATLKTATRARREFENHLEQETCIFVREREEWAVQEVQLKSTIAKMNDRIAGLRERIKLSRNEKAESKQYANVGTQAVESSTCETPEVHARHDDQALRVLVCI